MNSEKIINIAKTCHEVNKAFCEGIGDNSQVSWEEATEDIRQSAIDGVRFLRKNPKSTAVDIHNNWLEFKMDDGWVFGLEKDPVKKTHPCMVRYKDLPKHQRTKDKLFSAIVKSFQ